MSNGYAANFVRQLRAVAYSDPVWACAQNCADEIERLSNENSRLFAALAKIADAPSGDAENAACIDAWRLVRDIRSAQLPRGAS